MAEYKIELKPQVGKKNHSQLGEIDVPIGQYSIKVNGKQVGLVCEKEGSPINWLPIANNFPKETRDKFAEVVRAELARLHGDSKRESFDPPSQESVDAADALIAKIESGEGSETGDDGNL